MTQEQHEEWSRPRLVALTTTGRSAAGNVSFGTEGAKTSTNVAGNGNYYLGPSAG